LRSQKQSQEISPPSKIVRRPPSSLNRKDDDSFLDQVMIEYTMLKTEKKLKPKERPLTSLPSRLTAERIEKTVKLPPRSILKRNN